VENGPAALERRDADSDRSFSIDAMPFTPSFQTLGTTF
jgi:hypothetical protein